MEIKRKKQKVGGLAHLDFNHFYRAVAIRIV